MTPDLDAIGPLLGVIERRLRTIVREEVAAALAAQRDPPRSGVATAKALGYSRGQWARMLATDPGLRDLGRGAGRRRLWSVAEVRAYLRERSG